MRRLVVGIAVLIALAFPAGCVRPGEGSVAKAEEAARAAPKSTRDLPAAMPEQARRQAGAAMAQQEAMRQQGDAQAAAMRAAQAQGRR